MDNFDIDKIPPVNNNEPIPLDDNDTSGTSISHSPLNLGGGSTTGTPKIEVPAEPAVAATKKTGEKVASTERITGVKTFFTKLHPGAMDFLDEQITKWLKDNPGISIKQTNTVTGLIQAKKTEPNIIISVWY